MKTPHSHIAASWSTLLRGLTPEDPNSYLLLSAFQECQNPRLIAVCIDFVMDAIHLF